MTNNQQKVESRVRDCARSIGYRVRKSRLPVDNIRNHGGFQLVDANNVVVCGSDYSATMEEIAAKIEPDLPETYEGPGPVVYDDHQREKIEVWRASQLSLIPVGDIVSYECGIVDGKFLVFLWLDKDGFEHDWSSAL